MSPSTRPRTAPSRALARTAALTLALTLSFGAGAGSARAAPPAGALTLDAWLVRATAALPDSPPVKALDAAGTAAETSIGASLLEAPWSVRSSIAHAQHFPRPNAMFAASSSSSLVRWDARARAELRYQTRSRLLASFAASVALYDVTGLDLGSAPTLPVSAELQVAYDVLRGSSASAEHDRARAAAARALSAKLALEANVVSAELSYLSLAVALYGNACKAEALEGVARGVKASLAAARVQRDAKVMSPADLMNFEHLANVVATESASLTLERDGLLQDLEVWGDGAAAAARALPGAPLACAPTLSDRPGLAAAQAADLARRLPSHAAALADRWAAALELSATRTEKKASLSPYLLGRVSRQAGDRDAIGTAEAGIELSWDVAGARGDAVEKAAVEAFGAAGRRVEQVLAEETAAVRRLSSTFERSYDVIAALQATVTNADRLEHALDVQRAIGEVNALNQTTAVVNGLSAKLGVVDAWIRATLAERQLALLTEAADRYAADAARLADRGWAE